jgi:hypothetical protein
MDWLRCPQNPYTPLMVLQCCTEFENSASLTMLSALRSAIDWARDDVLKSFSSVALGTAY